ncbi:hypothetical protein F5H01DRAFT_349194 [Linnemannia elongata]|nr:hypothetical protein F5H01DRAFT_349194 [Linnemannia elongata]
MLASFFFGSALIEPRPVVAVLDPVAVVAAELGLVAVAVAALVLVLADAEDDDEVWPVKANRRHFNFRDRSLLCPVLMDVLLQRLHRREQRTYLDSDMSNCT